MRLRDLCLSPSAKDFSTQPLLAVEVCGARAACWRLLRVFSVLLLSLVAIVAQAQQYTKIVVFGDSLSDTGNDLPLFLAEAGLPIPSPAFGYTLGRFTDGKDTFPPATNFTGVWIEQMAAALPAHPPVIASVNGGTNFAYGFADTFGGTSQFTPLPVFVHNVGLQIDEYMATNPKIDSHTLFVVWAGANNLTAAVPEPNAAQLIVDGAIAQIGNVQRLINAGATQFLVPNLPNLGSVPRFNVSPADAAAFNKASVLYNATLDAGVSLLPLLNFGRHVTIHKLDVYSLLKSVIAQPANFGLVNATDESQSMLVDPDTYLFWDDLHPTTHGHNIVGMSALKAIEPPGCVQQASPGEYVGVAASGCR
jgi:phospholipase/lecithinase/hemolysin